jgi:protein NrfD
MIEELIISGRNNPEIDPHLHIWGWEIPLYLFIGGLVAGILFFSALYTILGKEDKYVTAVKWLPIGTPILIGIGLLALLFDLSHVLYSWQLFTNIRWESPMSWGAWTLLIMTPLSVLWAVNWFPDIFPKLDFKYDILKTALDWVISIRIYLAWSLIVLSVILGIYTGILLSAFNARPFWNTAIMGPLFLTSGLSTGAATTILFSKNHDEKLNFAKIDLGLIAIELFFIIHLFMGALAGTQVHIEAAKLFLGGPYTTSFWIFVVVLGLIIPAFLEALELKKYKIPSFLSAVLVIVGGLILRFIIVDAGQASRWLY